MTERRKFIRFDIPFKAEVLFKDNLSLSVKAVTKDFSREGLSIILHSQIPEHATVDLRLRIPKKEKPVLIKAKVVALKLKDQDYLLSMRIIDIDASIKNEILEIAYKQWCKNKKKEIGKTAKHGKVKKNRS